MTGSGQCFTNEASKSAGSTGDEDSFGHRILAYSKLHSGGAKLGTACGMATIYVKLGLSFKIGTGFMQVTHKWKI